MTTPSFTLELWPHEFPVDGECPVCGYDDLWRLQAIHATPEGVGVLGETTICGRCEIERDRLSPQAAGAELER